MCKPNCYRQHIRRANLAKPHRPPGYRRDDRRGHVFVYWDHPSACSPWPRSSANPGRGGDVTVRLLTAFASVPRLQSPRRVVTPPPSHSQTSRWPQGIGHHHALAWRTKVVTKSCKQMLTAAHSRANLAQAHIATGYRRMTGGVTLFRAVRIASWRAYAGRVGQRAAGRGGDRPVRLLTWHSPACLAPVHHAAVVDAATVALTNVTVAGSCPSPQPPASTDRSSSPKSYNQVACRNTLAAAGLARPTSAPGYVVMTVPAHCSCFRIAGWRARAVLVTNAGRG